jgi:hypothetical protein
MRRESVEYLNPLFVLVVLVDAEVRVIEDEEEKKRNYRIDLYSIARAKLIAGS